jgi:hypothetical protein
VFLPPVGRTIIPGPESQSIEKTVDGMYLLLFRVEAAEDGLNRSNLQTVNAGQGTLDSGGVAGFAMPVMRYYVGTGGVAQIDEFNAVPNDLAPADLAEFGASQSVTFTWPSTPQAKFYRLLIESESGVELHSAILLRDTHSYRAPSWLLKNAPTDLLRWRVVSFDVKGVKVNETSVRTLRRITE